MLVARFLALPLLGLFPPASSQSLTAVAGGPGAEPLDSEDGAPAAGSRDAGSWWLLGLAALCSQGKGPLPGRPGAGSRWQGPWCSHP